MNREGEAERNKISHWWWLDLRQIPNQTPERKLNNPHEECIGSYLAGRVGPNPIDSEEIEGGRSHGLEGGEKERTDGDEGG